MNSLANFHGGSGVLILVIAVGLFLAVIARVGEKN